MIEFIIPGGLPAAGARARAELIRILETFGIDTARATLTVTDDNGPKGGRAMRCTVGLTLPRRRVVRAEHTATTVRLAVDGVLDKVERDLARLVERRRNAARHPKKYYAAKRLLGAPAPGARGSAKSIRIRRRTS